MAIARALINRQMMILADGPAGNLDPDLALEIMNLFREINAAGTTVLVATHDRELIRQVGCRAIMLDQGVIVEETLAAGDVSTYLVSSGATDEDEYERSTSSDTTGWGSVDQVGPLGLVEVTETVTDDSLATELHDVDDALEGVLSQWAAAAEMSVYLGDDVTPQARATVEQMLRESDLVTEYEFVSKEDALARFARDFVELAPVAEQGRENPMPRRSRRACRRGRTMLRPSWASWRRELRRCLVSTTSGSTSAGSSVLRRRMAWCAASGSLSCSCS